MSGKQYPELSKCPTWKGEPLSIRLVRCRAMLYLHGVLSEVENKKVAKRIAKRGLK